MSHLGRWLVHHRILDSGQLNDVLGHQILRVVWLGVMGGLGETAQKQQRRRSPHLEVELLQDVLLHAQDLFLGVRVVGDVHELGHLGRIHLLVFGGQE